MKHFIELTPDEFQNIDTPFLTPYDSRSGVGDELIITMKDHREQAVLGITRVIKEKVNAHYCYLCLSGIDDVKNLFTRNASQQGEQC